MSPGAGRAGRLSRGTCVPACEAAGGAPLALAAFQVTLIQGAQYAIVGYSERHAMFMD